MMLTALGFLFCVAMALWMHHRKTHPKLKKAIPMTEVTAAAPVVHHSLVQRVTVAVEAAAAEVNKIEAFVAAEIEKVAGPLRADLAAAEAQVAKLEGVVTTLASKMAGQSRAQDTATAVAAVSAAVPAAAPELAVAGEVVEAAFTAADAPAGAVKQA
jgi:hypothetical protein